MPDLDDFLGAWALDRRIEDRATGRAGHLLGQARFRREGEGLAYEEAGRLSMDGAAPLQARQRHLWESRAGRVTVRFGDGRPFHDFDPSASRAEGRHLCGGDLYLCVYDFSRWPDWTLTWTVTGPRKDYTSRSAYARP